MKTRSPLSFLALGLIIACGCSKPGDSTDAKRSPKPPPSAGVTVPATLHVDVEVDGAPALPVDANRLAALKPDFTDDEHRAWRLKSLLAPAASRPGAVVAAMGDKGVSLELHPETGPTDPAPVLSINRRGEVVVGLVAPDDPFPDFHGKGGRLNRPGNPLPHVASPTKLRVYVASPAGAATNTVGNSAGGGNGNGGGAQTTTGAAPLKVVIPGGSAAAWTPDALGAVARFTIHADGSDKDAWSLRDVTHQLVGPKARVVGAVDGDGTRAKIDAKDWADAKKTPVLRINRRGMYKIQWVDKDGNATNDDDVRDVRSIEIAPAG